MLRNLPFHRLPRHGAPPFPVVYQGDLFVHPQAFRTFPEVTVKQVVRAVKVSLGLRLIANIQRNSLAVAVQHELP